MLLGIDEVVVWGDGECVGGVIRLWVWEITCLWAVGFVVVFGRGCVEVCGWVVLWAADVSAAHRCVLGCASVRVC